MTLATDSPPHLRAAPGAALSLYAGRTGADATRARPLVAVPSEDVLIAVVDLPLASLRQRAASLPFAMEGLVSEPLSALHIVLGPEIAPKRHLAAAVRHSVMRRWIAALPETEANARLVPDALTWPVPAEAGWAVAWADGRALVRTADGGGFAIEKALLPHAWRAAGSPSFVSLGETLPDGMPQPLATLPFEAHNSVNGAGLLDLRQGIYAPRVEKLPALVKWAGMLAAAALAAHTAIAAVDLIALNRIADARESEARALLAPLVPGAAADGDLVDLFNRISPAGAGAPGVRFLPLMAQTAQALQPFAAAISVQTLAFSASDGSLSLVMEGPDLATLQAVEQALSAAGLDPVSGPATSARGAAEFKVTVRAAGAAR